MTPLSWSKYQSIRIKNEPPNLDSVALQDKHDSKFKQLGHFLAAQSSLKVTWFTTRWMFTQLCTAV